MPDWQQLVTRMWFDQWVPQPCARGVRTHHSQPPQRVHQLKAHLSPSVYWGFITLSGVTDMGHFIELILYIHFYSWMTGWVKPQTLNNILGFLE